ncbi:GNAT family N-acetyltransferase [Vibrio caribbeanicus]|uniref:GNAT family N-acetyltransferase n=1 Tax=Vibrio caribbeanicus TaxID=701175 RepID=UPI0030DBAB97
MYRLRLARERDFDFCFELKKAAEFEPIQNVFGWDEDTQKSLHTREWLTAKPTIIEIKERPVGSFLIEKKATHWYFGRFFLLPELQGQGVGSQILQEVTNKADKVAMPIHLSYLQTNRVGNLYLRFGFLAVASDEQFMHMVRKSLPISEG